jgi:predicted nucleic acid-binding protein
VVGAHHVFRGCYYLKNETASELMQNFIESSNIYWYKDFTYTHLNQAFDYSSQYNIEGWDGYFAKAAEEAGANTIITIDERFERIDHIQQELVLSDDEKRELNEFLEELDDAETIESRFDG